MSVADRGRGRGHGGMHPPRAKKRKKEGRGEGVKEEEKKRCYQKFTEMVSKQNSTAKVYQTKGYSKLQK